MGTRYKKPSGISAVIWESITTITPIISAVTGSADWRFPQINMEKNGISGLSRSLDLISFYDLPT
jgi:Mg2+/Co2+ transporter CorC